MINVGIVNCGISNLTSVVNAFQKLSINIAVINESKQLDDCSHIVLPGVGSFIKGMENLKMKNLDTSILLNAKKGKPILGICLGMQLLANIGEEFGLTKGLGLINGNIKKINTEEFKLKLPHVGWNNIQIKNENSLWNKIPDLSTFYFIHSYAYYDINKDFIIGECEYGNNIVAAVANENIFGVQFHPEKSQKPGLQLLKNFTELC